MMAFKVNHKLLNPRLACSVSVYSSYFMKTCLAINYLGNFPAKNESSSLFATSNAAVLGMCIGFILSDPL